ncbi:phosphoribosyltransferase [Roseateles aquatilis]|uniref:Orotate phosphoribosyltransferase n=1 Tax=Roseateles aquatilis TaxID=431061 RepID=A0A246JM34_9BURK|nr:phosphoribosyltransferase family protein [Roseateles aquatilis]OWQ93708.1 phosphoribosyltransferase [Roseateles aquatilis]
MLLSPSGAPHIAQALVAADAVRLAGDTPFFYTSGWASPVYVDVHALLGDAKERTALMDGMAEAVAPLIGRRGIGAVVGTESSGIAIAAWLADRLRLPMLTLRKRPIGWGVQAQLQGRLPQGCKVLLVDDVNTDGRSKHAAAAALRQVGAAVEDALVLLDYAIYPKVAPVQPPLCLLALVGWEHLHVALQNSGKLTDAQCRTLKDFSESPTSWSVAHGGTGALA